ncbi:DUF342 domain-containing protein [Psychromonas sp. KJ10-10]|uniref:DUF342 domain-containing protein n=1 Tax=Psychromonas sp. KJ10-10 TaxID=3391823 RepID=UPI0039B51DA7
MDNKQPLSDNLLRLSPDKKQLLLLITPIKEEVTIKTIAKLVQDSEYANLKLNPKGIKEAVQLFSKLQSDDSGHSNLDSVAVADRIHAKFTIEIDPLKMTAKAILTNAYGGLPITLDGLKAKMDELEISEGIINKNLLLLVKQSKKESPGSTYQAIIAQGTPVVHGTDSLFESLVETPTQRQLKPKINEDGTVDMRDLGQLNTVKSDTPLMRKIPCTEGTDGINILGEVIPHTSGKDFKLEVGANTKISEQDENLLVSTLPGIPKLLNTGMQVDDVLVVQNVDVGSGHVEYEGNIVIKGDVCSGMKVKATGDISISGFVESAYIECTGNLTVAKGIIGHKIEEGNNNYSCVIKSEGNVSASFSQYSKITAGSGIHIKTQLLHCAVSCKDDIIVLDTSGMRGTIIGGVLETSNGVFTASLGSVAGSKAFIHLGAEYAHLLEAKKQIKQKVQLEQDKLKDLIDAQKKVHALPNSEKKQTLDIRLTLTIEETEHHLTSLKQELEDHRNKLMESLEHTKVVAQKEMFNNINVSIGKEKFSSNRKYGPTQISLVDFKLMATPYNK